MRGRPMRVQVVGDPAAPRRTLVVGCVHGTERAGEEVVRALEGAPAQEGTAYWLVRQANPDGCARRTRGNARGVDLNRNQALDWRPLRGLYSSGTGPRSEPESRAIRHLVRAVRPTVSIWFHQQARLVDRSGGDPAVERCYASQVGLPYRFFGRFPGSITSWQNASYPTATAFVVELPPGPLNTLGVVRHVAAARSVGALGAAACVKGV